MPFEFELKLDKKALSFFMLRYNYTKVSGLVNVVLGLAAAFICIWRWNSWTTNQVIAWIAIAALLLVVQPLMLINRARTQMAREAMKTPMKIRIDEEGVTVSQEESSHCTWDEVRKIKYYKDAIYIFTSNVHATIVTRISCESQFDEIVTFLKGIKKA